MKKFAKKKAPPLVSKVWLKDRKPSFKDKAKWMKKGYILIEMI